MANLMNIGTFYPRRLSQYVPALTYCADVQIGDNGRFSFGAPALANQSQFLVALSIAAAVVVPASSMLNSAMTDAPYGRTLSFALSGAGAGTMTIDGYDYLNQPVSENIAYNGATVVNSKKAIKYLRQLTFTAVASTTVGVGVGPGLGLPFKAIKVWTEEANGVPATVGTLTNPDLTDPATATTGDTRGTYAPNTALNGASVISATFEFANDVNAANNGGLHGISHFAN